MSENPKNSSVMTANTNTFIRPDEIESDGILTKCAQIHGQLRKELFFGSYSAGQRFFSLRELKKRYDVDPRTIRAALDPLIQGGALVCKPTTGIYVGRRRANAMREFLGNVWFFQPGPDKNNPFYNSILTALQKQAGLQSLKVIVDRNSNEEEFFRWFQPETGDGLVLTGRVNNHFIQSIRQRPGLRYVVVGNYDLPPDTPNIRSKISNAVYKCVKELAKAGRRRLGVIGAPLELRSMCEIREGVDRAIKDDLIDFAEGIFKFPEDGHAGMRQLEDKKIDCVFSTSPAYFGVCRYIFERGVKCPQDLMVVHFGKPDDDVYSDIASIEMTSDKDVWAVKILDILFRGGPKQIEWGVDILRKITDSPECAS